MADPADIATLQAATPEKAVEAAAKLLRIPYCLQVPTSRQATFLLDFRLEVLYGGAAAGGKSSALLMAALQFADVPGYSAIIMRRSFTDLSLPGALMDRSRQWLGDRAKWTDAEHVWTFPSGATLAFGYIERANDRLRYQGSEFQFIGIDEVTQWKEADYRYMFSRLRRITSGHLSKVPVRMRAGTNPGGPGHDWCMRRFVLSQEPLQRGFITARLEDNPHVDQESYEQSLMQLDALTRKQLRYGDWWVHPSPGFFNRAWFDEKALQSPPSNVTNWVRYWDLAATEPRDGQDPDYTVGALVGRTREGMYVVADIQRFRASPAGVERIVRETASMDSPAVNIYIEQEPGASGKALISHYQRVVLDGYAVRANRTQTSKTVRAKPFAARCEEGHVYLIMAPWNDAFLDEFESFPEGEHDDQVDAVCGAMYILSRHAVPTVGATGNSQRNPWRV